MQNFLTSLFGEIPDNLRFLIWELPRKYSHWHSASDIQGAVDYAAKKREEADLYYGVGLSPRPFGIKARCPSSQIAGVVGVWADIDIADPVHSKNNLPSTAEEALSILGDLPSPTWLIHSGHGLQALWLYKEPWIFDDDAERKSAAELSAAWIYTIRERFRSKGYDVDSTIDLARILRLPGTMNLKDPKNPCEVKVLSELDERYSIDDLGGYITGAAWEASRKRSGNTSVGTASFVLDPMGEPSMSAFVALMENEPKFAKSWSHKRRDLKDQSASSYDMSLAALAVIAGWNDQQVVNLLVAHRRKHGADLKLREDYYSRTLAAAKSTAFGGTVSAQAIEDVEQLKNDDTIPEDEKRAAILNAISGALKIKITKIVRYTTDPTQYRVYSGMDNAKFKSPDEYIQQTKFRATLFGAFKRLPPTFKAEEWVKLLQLMADIMEDEDAGDEATEKGSIIGWLEGYLKDRPPVPITESFEPGYPVIIDGIIHISTKPLIQWLWTSIREKHTAQALGPMLSNIGAEQRRVHVESDYGRTTRSLWALPGGEYEWNTGYTDPLEQERQDT